MPNIVLSEARLQALRPRNSAYDVRDAALRGFGIRVLPTGAKRFFVHVQHRGRRTWRIVGDPRVIDLDEARTRAASMRASIRRGADTPALEEDTRFEAVAAAVFRRYAQVWKPETLKVNRSYLRRRLLPAFSGRQIGDITPLDVQRWFASCRATPVSADRSMPVLSVIMKEAELRGYRPEGSNPCRGVRRYRRTERERFLSEADIGRIAARLAAYERERPLEVAAIRLLLLTGCRKREVFTLRWSDYRAGHLFLRDSKTGPRTVWLSRPARGVIEGIPRNGTWVFRSGAAQRPEGWTALERFWRRVRGEAQLHDVRLHDLRHFYATFALKQGESVLVIGRLLGHANPETTLKYTHLADAMVHEAAAIVGAALEG